MNVRGLPVTAGAGGGGGGVPRAARPLPRCSLRALSRRFVSLSLSLSLSLWPAQLDCGVGSDKIRLWWPSLFPAALRAQPGGDGLGLVGGRHAGVVAGPVRQVSAADRCSTLGGQRRGRRNAATGRGERWARRGTLPSVSTAPRLSPAAFTPPRAPHRHPKPPNAGPIHPLCAAAPLWLQPYSAAPKR